jgi:hypothetical protein
MQVLEASAYAFKTLTGDVKKEFHRDFNRLMKIAQSPLQ